MIQAILFNSSQKLASVLSFYLQRTQTSERFSSHELPKSDLITSEYVTPQTATGMKKCQRSKIAVYKVLFKLANHLPSGVVGVTYSLLYQIFSHFLSSVLSSHWKRLRRREDEERGGMDEIFKICGGGGCGRQLWKDSNLWQQWVMYDFRAKRT